MDAKSKTVEAVAAGAGLGASKLAVAHELLAVVVMALSAAILVCRLIDWGCKRWEWWWGPKLREIAARRRKIEGVDGETERFINGG